MQHFEPDLRYLHLWYESFLFLGSSESLAGASGAAETGSEAFEPAPGAWNLLKELLLENL